MAEAAAGSLDAQALEALKSLGKALGQMTLYKIGHPAVAATLELAREQLGQALAQTPGELVFTTDHDKLIANGRIVGSVKDLPSAISSIFSRFKLSSLTFKTGVDGNDLAAFCEIAVVRPGAAAAGKPAEVLGSKGVTRILLNEAVYAKMDATHPKLKPIDPNGPRPQEPTAAPTQPPLAQTVLSATSLDAAINSLVESAVPQMDQRQQVLAKVMELVRADVEKRIDEVTRDLKRETTLLSNEQARTGAVLSSMVEGVVMVDEQGKILMMNPAAEQLYGTTLAEAAGQPLASKAGEAHVVTLANEILRPEKAPKPEDVAVTGEQDTRRTIKASGAIVQNQDGKVVGMVSQLTEVSKQKELQRVQGDFVAHVTHELRAPLASIRAALEIVQNEASSKMGEVENRILASALKNSDRLADLINSILDFSKIESGQMTVFPKKCDPEKIARDGVDSLAAWASKKRINLSLVAEHDLPPVAADQSRSVQVLVNLLSNSIKFTPAGGSITVRVGASSERSGSERFIQYAVTDTGPGIPKNEQKRIFEKFVQIASGEMNVTGTGLGLSIAKALIHLQGGKMWVESEEGRGATFFFTLPVYTVARAATPAPEPAKATAARKPWWKRLLGR